MTENDIIKKEGKKKEQARTTLAKKKFLELIVKHNGNILETCKDKNLDIATETYYRWLREDKEFAKKVTETIDFYVVKAAEESLKREVARGNITAIIFTLVNRGGGRWVNIQKVEHNSPAVESKVDMLIKEVREAFKK